MEFVNNPNIIQNIILRCYIGVRSFLLIVSCHSLAVFLWLICYSGMEVFVACLSPNLCGQAKTPAIVVSLFSDSCPFHWLTIPRNNGWVT